MPFPGAFEPQNARRTAVPRGAVVAVRASFMN
jgi:hypothetical protein